MIFEDFHIHSSFSDGKNTAEEIVLSAIDRGMKKIGISDHSYTEFDKSYCIKTPCACEYIAEIGRLKEKYRNKIEIFCGVERDFYSDCPTDGFDYSIGSVHYIKQGGEYIPVDESAEILKRASEKYFNGDIYALIEAYFETVSQVIEKTDADIIGHFDLISKFNEKNALFHEDGERYLTLAKRAADRLLKYSKPFEINTGAVSRGYRSEAYPCAALIDYIVKNGGKLVLSSDSHSRESVMFEFDKYYSLYKNYIINFSPD